MNEEAVELWRKKSRWGSTAKFVGGFTLRCSSSRLVELVETRKQSVEKLVVLRVLAETTNVARIFFCEEHAFETAKRVHVAAQPTREERVRFPAGSSILAALREPPVEEAVVVDEEERAFGLIAEAQALEQSDPAKSRQRYAEAASSLRRAAKAPRSEAAQKLLLAKAADYDALAKPPATQEALEQRLERLHVDDAQRRLAALKGDAAEAPEIDDLRDRFKALRDGDGSGPAFGETPAPLYEKDLDDDALEQRIIAQAMDEARYDDRQIADDALTERLAGGDHRKDSDDDSKSSKSSSESSESSDDSDGDGKKKKKKKKKSRK